MKKILMYLSLVFGALLISACTSTVVNNIDNSSTFMDNHLTSKKVEMAIKKGSSKRGWLVKKHKMGLITARNNIRGKHLVIVNISYNKNGYKIDYKDSQNMKYNPSNNTIHKNYNKWIANLERDINYELSLSGMNNVNSTTKRKINKKKKGHKYGGKFNIDGKTIYIKSLIPYKSGNRIASNIKAECTIDQQLSNFIKQYSQEKGINIKFKNNIRSNDLQLKVEIIDAVSRGGAFRGHNKYVSIRGKLIKGNKSYGSFEAARVSGGGFWGAYKSSCAVLGRTVKALGQDVSTWLYSPINNAKLGDIGYIR